MPRSPMKVTGPIRPPTCRFSPGLIRSPLPWTVPRSAAARSPVTLARSVAGPVSMDRRTALPALLLFLTSGCGQDLVLPRQGDPALVAVVSGQSQQGIVGDAVQDSLIIKVTDFEGRPVTGQPIGTNLLNGGLVEAAAPRTDDGGGSLSDGFWELRRARRPWKSESAI